MACVRVDSIATLIGGDHFAIAHHCLATKPTTRGIDNEEKI